jgi:predicted PurR-regulated permease PerM
MKTKNRFPKYLIIAVCAVVLVLSVVTVIGTWSFVSKASTTVVELLNTVETTSITIINGLDKVTTRLDQAHQIAQDFQSGATQISQGVQEQGIILTLLPLLKDEQLKGAVQSIQDTFAGLKDNLSTFSKWVQIIGKIPFLNMVGIDTSKLQGISDKISALQATVENITTAAAEIRAQAAGGVEKLATAVGNFDAQLTDINNSLVEIRNMVAQVQTAAGQLKASIPTLFTTFAFVLTLFLAWVIYSQVVLIRRALADLREIKALSAGDQEPVQENPNP